jgi:hypothetical protein
MYPMNNVRHMQRDDRINLQRYVNQVGQDINSTGDLAGMVDDISEDIDIDFNNLTEDRIKSRRLKEKIRRGTFLPIVPRDFMANTVSLSRQQQQQLNNYIAHKNKVLVDELTQSLVQQYGNQNRISDIRDNAQRIKREITPASIQEATDDFLGSRTLSPQSRRGRTQRRASSRSLSRSRSRSRSRGGRTRRRR